MGRFIFMWVSSWCLLPHLECPEPSEWSNRDDMEDAMEIELLSLSKPRSGEGDWNLGDCSLWSLLFLLCTQPWKGCQGVCLSSGTSCADWSPSGEALEVLNLKGCWAGRFTRGHPSPLAFTLLSNTAHAMALLPLVMSWGWQWGRPIFLPKFLHLSGGMWHL